MSVFDRLAEDGISRNKTITVTFYRQGNNHDTGKTYIWNMSRQFTSLDQMRSLLTAEIPGPTGVVRTIHVVDGSRIDSLDELKDGGKYICVGGEGFQAGRVPPHALGQDALANLLPSAQHQESTDAAPTPQLEALIEDGISKNLTKVCFFYGAKNQAHVSAKGIRMVVNPTRYRTVDQLIGEIRGKGISLVTGAVTTIYSFDGEKLEKIDDLIDQMKYVCSIKKPFAPSMIPDRLDFK